VKGSASSAASKRGSDDEEGSTPSETEEEPTSNVGVKGAGNVGAPAILPRHLENKKLLMLV
jgi:hypothetical protein